MKLAMISPTLPGHEDRGTGVYSTNLTKALETYADIEVVHAVSNTLPVDVDIYHFPYFDPFFLTLPLIRRRKTVVTIHDLIPLIFPTHFLRGIRGELKWQIQKRMLLLIDAVITDSYASKADIRNFTGINEFKIHVVYLAPDNIFFKRLSEVEKNNTALKYRLPKEFALYVGDANWNKNLPNIISAVDHERVPLAIVSNTFIRKHDLTYHPWKESLVEAQDKANKNPLIKALGRVSKEELAALYQLASVLLMPSYYEGFGLPVVEAFASMCPVITSHTGSLKEVAGGAALIVNPAKVEELVKALRAVTTSSRLRKNLIKKGKEQVKQFTWKKTAQQTAKIYEKILTP